MIVVDTGVVAYFLLAGEHTGRAEGLMRRDRDWAAPLAWRSEFRDILAGLQRGGSIGADLAKRVAAEAEGILQGREYAVRSDAVLDAAAISGCPAHDCEFVVLARDLGVPLVTTNAGLLAAFPRIATPLPA